MLQTSVCAGQWFLQSGIQEANGGVARYHWSDRKQNAPVSSEITGYFMDALVDLYEEDPQSSYLNAALEAGQFLTAVAWDDAQSAMPFECEGEGSSYSYFFDNGIIVRALLSLWKKTKRPELLTIAFKCAESMSQDFFDGQDF